MTEPNRVELSRRLVDAETALAQAKVRLENLRAAALWGSYDADVFDRAVVAWRAAKARAEQAREAWAAGHPVEPVAPPAPAPDPEAPYTPTAREDRYWTWLRWLVDTRGHLDWTPAEAAEAAQVAVALDVIEAHWGLPRGGVRRGEAA